MCTVNIANLRVPQCEDIYVKSLCAYFSLG